MLAGLRSMNRSLLADQVADHGSLAAGIEVGTPRVVARYERSRQQGHNRNGSEDATGAIAANEFRRDVPAGTGVGANGKMGEIPANVNGYFARGAVASGGGR